MALGGSKFLDNRHRRRLLLEAEIDGSAAANVRDVQANSSSEAGTLSLCFSLADFVPQKLWKCWAIGAAGGVISAALLSAWFVSERASSAGSVLGDLAAPLTDRLLRGSGAIAWLLAAQLSCVIWWVRSRSRVDYSGRFHVWGWAATGLFIAAILNLTDAHHLVAQLLAWSMTGAIERSSGVTAIWLLPASVAGLTLWATLAPEFRDNVQSRVLHSLAAASAVLSLITELSSRGIGSLNDSELIGKLSLAVMQWSSLMSIWLHLRHVVHVTADPPAIGTSGWLAAWRYGPGRVMSAFARQKSGLPEETLDESQMAPIQNRVQVGHTNGTSQDLRIDDAETKLKGPNKRARQPAKK